MTIKVLLVGCGITSAITVKLLQSQFENINITIWEKLNECGGRFRTVLSGTCSSNDFSTDLGAQYITTTEESIKCCNTLYSSLFKNNILKIMNNEIKGMKQLPVEKINYVSPSGMKAVVEHFLQPINSINICYGHNLITLDLKFNKWSASTDSGVKELFDIVVLTLPVPEIFNLNGDIKSLISNDHNISRQLSAVKYSLRFATGLFFEVDVISDFDAEYIDDDPILRYVATDRWKRKDNKFRSAVVHTTIQFGEKHFNNDLSEIEAMIMKQVEKLYSYWPKPSSIVTLQWKYSQVLQPYVSKPGAIILSAQPLLIAGGDGFIGSTFDQCVFSAKKISCSDVEHSRPQHELNLQAYVVLSLNLEPSALAADTYTNVFTLRVAKNH